VPAHHQPIEDPTPQVRIEVVDHLPPGRLVARAEAPHETVFLVLAGLTERDFPTFLSQLEGVMKEAVESQTWGRCPVGASIMRHTMAITS
jgi:hypothetical protein